jgi:hypothetical protein
MQPQSYPLYVRAIRRDVTPSPTRTRAGVIIGWQPLPDLPDQDGPVVTWLAPIASPIAVPLSPEEWDWTITTDQPQPQEPDVPGHRPASRSEPARTLSAGRTGDLYAEARSAFKLASWANGREQDIGDGLAAAFGVLERGHAAELRAAYGRGRDDEAAGLDIPEEYR